MYQIIEYIKFIYKSTNQHGVHSPFVYKLITDCFYDTKKKEAYNIIQAYRNQLFKTKHTINVTDLGSGSRVFKSNQRPISKIAKNAGITYKRAKLLHRLVTYLKAKTVLELGTSLGMATSAMAVHNPKTNIITIEGCPETAKIAKTQFLAFNFNNIQILNNNFSKVLKTIKNQPFDLIYLDGNHQKEATLEYFEALTKMTHNDTVVILDDIHWSQGMTEAWKSIQEHPMVTVTIDTFFWGFVFFRTEQAKEHFKIRV